MTLTCIKNLYRQAFFQTSLVVGCMLSMAPGQVLAQTPASLPGSYNTNIKINYVRTWDATAPEQSPSVLVTRPLKDVKQSTTYIDGLGRPIQTVLKQASLKTGTAPVDLVSPVVYDEFGRERVKYLPFGANNAENNNSVDDGLFKINPFQQQSQFYNNQLAGQSGETNVNSTGRNWAYTQVEFEASPLNRTLESFAPGKSWVGTSSKTNELERKSVKAKYYFNTGADSVKIWTVSGQSGDFGAYAVTGTYDAGMLYKKIAVNEQGKQVISYTDKEGQLILMKVQHTATADNGTGSGYYGWLCTYYMYDALNRLRCVLPPVGLQLTMQFNWDINANSGNILGEQCFRYEYDHLNRTIKKKMPGAWTVNLVYDQRDRVVLTQDSNMRVSKQWLYTLYDELNRPVATGLITDNANWNNPAYHQNLAATSTAYPNLSNYSTKEELTNTFYDNYKWRANYSNPLSEVYNTSYDIYLVPGSLQWPYPQTNVQSLSTTGLVTGTRAKVLGSSSTYVYTVNIYDDNGRVIQTQASNLASGEDFTTTQYSWSGQPLIVAKRIRKAGTNNPQTHVVVNTLNYDDLGRVLTVKKYHHAYFNNTGQHLYKNDQVMVQNEYDELGRIKKKRLSPTGGPGNTPLDTLTYDYNVRGWLLGVNRDYAKDTNSITNRFGYELAYDKSGLVVNGVSAPYADSLFNGNIAGMLWKSAGDNRVRRYDFTYDQANRLTNAYFNQFTGSSFNLNAGIDFSAFGINYDANGNFLTMNQKGWKPGGSVTIDSLQYNYFNSSNKLRNVIDHVNDTATKLGDFRASGAYMQTLPGGKNTGTNDYAWDGNGNLFIDKNKNIGTTTQSGILYNYLDLPGNVYMRRADGKATGRIQYYYDAFGNKLRKVVSDSTVTPTKVTTTLYLGGAVFENDTLQSIAHEEGRLRLVKRYFTNNDSAYQLQYDYFLKDHLGNVRMVLTEQVDTARYIATMEAIYRTKEDRLFYNIPKTSYARALVSGYPNDPTTSPNDSLARVNGSGNKVGPALVLKVMSGDKVDIGVKSFYKSNSSAGPNSDPMADILASLATGVVGIAGDSKGSLSVLNGGSGSPLWGALNSFRSANNPSQGSNPSAYLNWILMDEQFKYVQASSGALPVGAADIIQALSPGTVNITKNGYLYVYVSNETQNWDVFFDNLSVQHTTGSIAEETHYYPFGLTMAGISSKAVGKLDNKYKFHEKEKQENEFSDGNSTEWYDFGARMFDPQLGRWMVLDPLSDFSRRYTPYHYAYDNPLRYTDPEGMITYDPNLNGGKGGYVDQNGNEVTNEDAMDQMRGMAQNIYSSSNEKKGTPRPTAVLLIGGADLLNGLMGLSEATKQIRDGIENAQLVNAVNYEYGSDIYTELATLEEWAIRQHQNGNRLIFYGYSKGGDVMHELVKRLAQSNIPVELLITVDAADGPFTDEHLDRVIPDNVKTNINFYQTKIKWSNLTSHGGPNERSDHSTKGIANVNMTNSKFGGEDIHHGNIDEAAVQGVIMLINRFITY